MVVQQGYKESPLGIIPEAWKVDSLGNICEIFVGRDLNEDSFSKQKDSDYPYPVYSNTVDNEGLYGYYKVSEYAGDALTVVGRGIGLGTSFARVGRFGAIGRLLVLFPKKGYNNFFLSYYINNRIRIFEESGGIPQLTGLSISRYLILVPPLHEQVKIAEVLLDFDTLIAQTEKLIEKKKAIKQGVMQELLKPKEGWETRKFGEIFSFLRTASYSRAELCEDDVIGYVHYGDIHTKYDSFINVEKVNLPCIRRDKLKSNSVLKDGDIIMADASEDYAGVGKSVEVLNIQGRQIISGLHTILLRDEKSVFIDGYRGYIQYCETVKKQLKMLATGLKVYSISKTILKTIDIPIPPIEEQRKIVNVLDVISREILITEVKLEKLKLQKQGMMQTLLTGKIRLV